MRPAGEIRQALSQAAHDLANERGGATWRDLAERAGVGYAAARNTVVNMERAGVLERVGFDKREHSNRWMSLYVPRSQGLATQTDQLGQVMRTWAI